MERLLTEHVTNTELELALLDAVSEILAAYVTTNQVDQAHLPGLVAATRTALSGHGSAQDTHAPIMPKSPTKRQQQAIAEAPAREKSAEKPVTQPPKQALEPAVPVSESVEEDVVVCLECGARMKTLRRHLMSAHELDEKAYRARWSLSKEHPMTAPSYTKRRQEVAKQIGLGAKRKKA